MIWEGPVAKKLTETELAMNGSHSAGIRPVSDTEEFFGSPYKKDTHHIKTIVMDIYSEESQSTILTYVGWKGTSNHEYIRVTGNISPALKDLDAEPNDILLFWRSSENNNRYKAKLVSKESEDWEDIKESEVFGRAGGWFKKEMPSHMHDLPSVGYSVLAR